MSSVRTAVAVLVVITLSACGAAQFDNPWAEEATEQVWAGVDWFGGADVDLHLILDPSDPFGETDCWAQQTDAHWCDHEGDDQGSGSEFVSGDPAENAYVFTVVAVRMSDTTWPTPVSGSLGVHGNAVLIDTLIPFSDNAWIIGELHWPSGEIVVVNQFRSW